MSVLKCIHHINFIVADLDAAVDAYQRTLGLGPFEYEELEERDVKTARVRIGDSWIVLVSPRSKDSPAAHYLKTHGEGFFLMSFGVDNLDQAMAELTGQDALTAGAKTRTGILGWQVADLDTEDSLGAKFHITEVK
jgi:methylmalonyl-CoA/ethylmalonyl-CoA epimerase